MKVTIFQNFTQVIAQQEISDVLDQIKSGKFSKQVATLQKLVKSGNLDEYNEKKKSLLAFTPCGTFIGGRKPQYFKEYSGLVILDFDKLTENHLQLITEKAPKIPYTLSLFKSPSGNGCKILIPIAPPLQENFLPHSPSLQGGDQGEGKLRQFHLQAFNQVRVYYEKALSLQVDPSGKDLTRLCFFSSDPDLYYNPSAEIFPISANSRDVVPPRLSKSTDVPPARLSPSIQNQIESIIQQLEYHHIDITTPYDNWLKLCFALIDGAGINARDYFHRISRINPEYDYNKCEKQFDQCQKSNNSGITIKTFFDFAKDHGITCKDALSGRLTQKKHPHNTALTPSTDALSGRLIPPEPQNEITGQTRKDDPPGRLRKGENRTNKFHLVRDYLAEHYDIRYNIVSTNFEYRVKGEEEFQPMNENNIFINMCLDGLFISINNLMAFLKSDFVPRYNPFTQYFESLPPWDGKTDHIKRLCEFVILKADLWDRFDKHFKKWLVRVVKCALVDSYFNKQAFILVHDKQNSGKSTFCRFLCPPALSNHIAENLSIDKDSRILLTTNLLINLDELSTLSKVEINSLKSLFSKDKINDRLPYDRKNSIIPRRASFIGSTNQAEFLNDISGSVRWLCFVIDSIDWSYKQKVNIDEVWAQAYALIKSGFECDLTPEEIKENDEYNKQFQITTSEYELIHKYFSPATKESHDDFMSATDILLYLAEQTNGKVKLNTNNVGKALKMLSFAREKKYPEKSYAYYVFKKIV
ncbi:MAG TPA: hypothetical protein DEH02_11595 [Bacteroidales bacterium]|nr:hypothetical protein [Bacteroidales bacterium]